MCLGTEPTVIKLKQQVVTITFLEGLKSENSEHSPTQTHTSENIHKNVAADTELQKMVAIVVDSTSL